MSILWKTLVALVCLYLLVLVALYVMQRQFVFAPNAERVMPSAVGLGDVSEVPLRTPDGETLVTWRREAGVGQPTILYFHGNAGNLASRAERAAAYAAADYGVFMLSLRGYGGSTGTPSEPLVTADAQLAYETLRKSGVAARDIVAYGESLGTGVATRLATEQEVGALILDAPFTALVDVAQREQPWFPVSWLLSDRFESLSRIGKLKAPLLVMHGEKDPLVPFAMGEQLYEAAPEPKRFVPFPNGHHSDLYEHGAMDAVKAFLDDVRDE